MNAAAAIAHDSAMNERILCWDPFCERGALAVRISRITQDVFFRRDFFVNSSSLVGSWHDLAKYVRGMHRARPRLNAHGELVVLLGAAFGNRAGRFDRNFRLRDYRGA